MITTTNYSSGIHEYDSGNMLSDMIRIDISDNIESIGHCHTSNSNKYYDYNVGNITSLSNNITIYLPRIDGYARNKPSLKTETFTLVCRRGEIKEQSYDCFGTNITLKCDGKDRKTLEHQCNYNILPSCQSNINDSILFNNKIRSSSISNDEIGDVCHMIDFNHTYVICSCDICLFKRYQQQYNMHRRLQSSTPISYSIQIVSLTEYVLEDFTNVITEASLIWDGDTYKGTVTVTIFVGTLWFLISITIVFIEYNIRINNEPKIKDNTRKIIPKISTNIGHVTSEGDDLLVLEKERI